MSKKFWDPTLFSDPISAIDLLRNSIRQGLKYDALGGPEFIARVLTVPQAVSPAAASALIAPTAGVNSAIWAESYDAISATADGTGAAAATAQRAKVLNAKTNHLSYMARIEEIHGAFLEDPCSPAVSDDPNLARVVISQHTQIITAGKSDRDVPTPGDYVKVRLQKGDNGSWNLQHGLHVEMYEDMASADGIPVSERCRTLADLFEGAVIEYVGDGLPAQLGTWDSTDGYVQVTPKSSAVVATTAITNFLEDLRTTIPASEVETLVVTSGERSAAAQASALYTKRSFNKCSSAISTIPASSDPCYAIYALYSNKTLIMEVLKVANSVASMQAVYQAQMDRGEFSSGHMSGLGVDLRTSNLTTTQRNYVIKQAKTLGASAIYENDPPHIHIGIPSSYGTSTTSLASSTSGDDAGVEDEDVS